MKKLVLVALLILAACFTPAAPAASSGDRTDYSCAHSAAFSARANGDAMEVFAGGQVYHLHSTPAPNGSSYTDGRVTFWTHMDMAALTGAAGGPYDECTLAH
jgi:membrane-bound inhibitor of C-type lysozyme